MEHTTTTTTSSSSSPINIVPIPETLQFLKPLNKGESEAVVNAYVKLHREDNDENDNKKKMYQQLVTYYYDIVTDFYEYGWGDCFHFAATFKSETFREAIQRHENYLVLRIGLKKDQQVLDIGCGIGGPMRNICRFSSARITGVNLSPYQCKRLQYMNEKAGGIVAKNCSVLNADFMNIPVEDNSFDHAYQIEATAHAPSKLGCYKEVFRCIKPGGYFAGYEWVLTKNFQRDNPYHMQIKKGIEEGDGLPDIATADDIANAIKEAGFELLEIRDVAPESEVDWYDPLVPKYTSFSNFQFTPIGKWGCDMALAGLEQFGLAPKGSRTASSVLMTASDSLVEGGRLKIFTPMLFHFARKPLTATS